MAAAATVATMVAGTVVAARAGSDEGDGTSCMTLMHERSQPMQLVPAQPERGGREGVRVNALAMATMTATMTANSSCRGHCCATTVATAAAVAAAVAAAAVAAAATAAAAPPPLPGRASCPATLPPWGALR